MKLGLLGMATAIVVGAAGGAGVAAHIERTVATSDVMVEWRFSRVRDGSLACQGMCQTRDGRGLRYPVAKPHQTTPEGCVEALRGACEVVP